MNSGIYTMHSACLYDVVIGIVVRMLASSICHRYMYIRRVEYFTYTSMILYKSHNRKILLALAYSILVILTEMAVALISRRLHKQISEINAQNHRKTIEILQASSSNPKNGS